jgi:hypothetical protein
VVVEVPEVRGVTTQWKPAGEAIVSSFRFRTYQRNQMIVSFPEMRQEEYRMVIHNEDNPPLDIQGVKPEGTEYRVMFLAQESKTYRVYFLSPIFPSRLLRQYSQAVFLYSPPSTRYHGGKCCLAPFLGENYARI